MYQYFAWGANFFFICLTTIFLFVELGIRILFFQEKIKTPLLKLGEVPFKYKDLNNQKHSFPLSVWVIVTSANEMSAFKIMKVFILTTKPKVPYKALLEIVISVRSLFEQCGHYECILITHLVKQCCFWCLVLP